MAKLHYDKDKLVEHYKETFAIFVRALLIAIGVVLVFFFLFVVYLGGWSHTPATPWVEEFGERIPLDYEGTKLPMFGGPATPEGGHH